MIRVTRFGGVQPPRPPRGPITVDNWRNMLRISARLVEEFGESALPLFERCERELVEAESRSAAMDRALAIAKLHRERQGAKPKKPGKPRKPR